MDVKTILVHNIDLPNPILPLISIIFLSSLFLFAITSFYVSSFIISSEILFECANHCCLHFLFLIIAIFTTFFLSHANSFPPSDSIHAILWDIVLHNNVISFSLKNVLTLKDYFLLSAHLFAIINPIQIYLSSQH